MCLTFRVCDSPGERERENLILNLEDKNGMDWHIQDCLSGDKVINWESVEEDAYVVHAQPDGHCLLHASKLAMEGEEMEKTEVGEMRNLIKERLIHDPELKKWWMKEQQKKEREMGQNFEGGWQMDEQEREREWEVEVAACERKYLGEIQILAWAQVVGRPVVVFA